MTTISSVDTTSSLWQHQSEQRSSQDFARELAKKDSQVHPDVQAAEKSESQAKPATQEAVPATEPDVESLNAMQEQSFEDAATAALLGDAHSQADAVVQPVGVTQALLGARVYGMHLLAQAYLSELAVSDDAKNSSASERVPSEQGESEPAVDQSEEGAVLPTRTDPMASSEVAASPLQAIDVLVQNATRLSADEAALPCALAATASSDAPAMVWSERSLRFTRQPDGGSVAWLRDYRMGKGEASQMVDAILKQASAQGVTLSRIMLNGREAWTSRSDI